MEPQCFNTVGRNGNGLESQKGLHIIMKQIIVKRKWVCLIMLQPMNLTSIVDLSGHLMIDIALSRSTISRKNNVSQM